MWARLSRDSNRESGGREVSDAAGAWVPQRDRGTGCQTCAPAPRTTDPLGVSGQRQDSALNTRSGWCAESRLVRMGSRGSTSEPAATIWETPVWLGERVSSGGHGKWPELTSTVKAGRLLAGWL